jgi:hypothetical protein
MPLASGVGHGLLQHLAQRLAVVRASNALGVLALLTAVAVPAVEVPRTGGAVVVGGWIDGTAVVDTGGGPYQAPWARTLLAADAELGRGWSLGLQLLAQAGGPYRDAVTGFYDFGDAFENDAPSLQVDEAYLAWQLRDADLRAGVQLFAWGRLDGIPPTDVLNPRSYHDPIVSDAEERKIGVPALAGTYYVPLAADRALSRLEVQLVYVPIAVPPRLALDPERWFPTSTAPVSQLSREDLAAYFDLPPEFVQSAVPIAFGTASNAPARTFEHGAIGARLGGTWRGVDWDAYYYGGPETQPDARLTATVLGRTAPDLKLRAVSDLVQEYDTIHMVAADAAFVVGPVSLRAEAAYFVDRPYLRRGSDVIDEGLAALPLGDVLNSVARHGRRRVPLPPLFVDLNAVEWGLGADMVWAGVRPLVQVSQIVPTERAPRLLIGEPETRITAMIRKPIWQERIELEVRTVYAIERGGWFALPRVTYLPRDDLRLRVGYLAIGGLVDSMIGQFGRNDEVLFDLRWSF